MRSSCQTPVASMPLQQSPLSGNPTHDGPLSSKDSDLTSKQPCSPLSTNNLLRSVHSFTERMESSFAELPPNSFALPIIPATVEEDCSSSPQTPEQPPPLTRTLTRTISGLAQMVAGLTRTVSGLAMPIELHRTDSALQLKEKLAKPDAPKHNFLNCVDPPASKSVARSIGLSIGKTIDKASVQGAGGGVIAAAAAALAAAAGRNLAPLLIVGKEPLPNVMQDLKRLLGNCNWLPNSKQPPGVQPAKSRLKPRARQELPPVKEVRPPVKESPPVMDDHENLKPATDLQSDLQWSLMKDDLQWPQKEATQKMLTKGPPPSIKERPTQKGRQQPVITPPEPPPPEQPLTKRPRRDISAECADRAGKVRRAAMFV